VTLAELLEAATPGPWSDGVGGIDGCYFVPEPAHPYEREGSAHGLSLTNGADARLIALAPDLARLALDMGEALRRMVRTEFESMREQNATTFGGLDHYFSDEERETIAALLARLDGIGNKDKTA